ncbi:hypothetical protein [Pantoea stewartii]|uniref:hypothetical protein n=1 Tax=Pantoea stewartii TaxID=66269 RepID=UPI0012470D6C|nr:hypothetical protein [Pantoea stewartii]KAB0555327.1 hypothetical protein F7Q90_09610 [Pantoea stewartii subsp. stewartii]
MTNSDIEHMAQGYPPSHIGKDNEEVVIELASSVIDLQQKLDAISAKALELCSESAHVYQKYNITQMPDRDLVDHQTIQELSDLIRSGTHETADKAG